MDSNNPNTSQQRKWAPSPQPAAVDLACEGEEVLVQGWPIARQRPKGQEGTMFVTVKDETGDAQLIVWLHVFRESRRDPRNLVVQARAVEWPCQHRCFRGAAYPPHVPMPAAHDWRLGPGR